jgi:hypothetical protein
VATQWRRAAADATGNVAFEGAGRIRIRPSFFQRLDARFDRVNAHGLVAAPVLLWALPTGQGRELSPGYYLPEPEAILLARYMVARYGAHHVVWILGGDGRYVGEYEQRWKTIGRGVFGGEHAGVVAMHSQGRSWIGREYALEDWLDVLGYQTGHGDDRDVVDWTTRGPVSQDWARLPARPTINMEPCYEQIAAGRIDAEDVRRASYRSLFAAPVAGISYGANGVWPWLRQLGEPILNHRPSPGSSPWHEGIRLPGSVQVGHLARFIQQLPWWTLRPAPELLAEQPGDRVPDEFVSVVKSEDHRTILVYLPGPVRARIRLPLRQPYAHRTFDPVAGEYLPGSRTTSDPLVDLSSPLPHDAVVVLTAVRDGLRRGRAEGHGNRERGDGTHRNQPSRGRAARSKAGSKTTPRPGPEGTFTTPFSARRGDVGDETGRSSVPLYSWCGPWAGANDAKWAAYRNPRPLPDMWGVHSREAASAMRATRRDRIIPPK